MRGMMTRRRRSLPSESCGSGVGDLGGSLRIGGFTRLICVVVGCWFDRVGVRLRIDRR